MNVMQMQQYLEMLFELYTTTPDGFAAIKITALCNPYFGTRLK